MPYYTKPTLKNPVCVPEVEFLAGFNPGLVPSLGAGNKQGEISAHTHRGDHLSGVPGFDEVNEHFPASGEAQKKSSKHKEIVEHEDSQCKGARSIFGEDHCCKRGYCSFSKNSMLQFC